MAIWAHTKEAVIRAKFTTLIQDAFGWTIFAPSADSRLIYVDSTLGNDGTAATYLLSTLPAGTWRQPVGIAPYATLEAATGQMRSGFPDYLLLKRGESFTLTTAQWQPEGGRSATERSFVTGYGLGPRPHFDSPASNGLHFRIWSDVNYIGIVGLHFYPTFRDPGHANFAGFGNTSGAAGIRLYAGSTPMSGVLIEDNLIEYAQGGIGLTSGISGEKAYIDTIIRRNVIRYCWNETAHAQGISGSWASVIVEENFFEHNGWYKQAIDPLDPLYPGGGSEEGQATVFNHNFYVSQLIDAIIHNNVSYNPSSIHFKFTSNPEVTNSVLAHDVILDDNLMIRGEVGMSLGGNDDFDDGPRFGDMQVCRNVMTRIGETQNTNRTLAWCGEIQDWANGFYGQNLIFKTGNDAVSNTQGTRIQGHCSNVAVSRNIQYDLGPITFEGGGGLYVYAQSGTMSNVLWAKNIIQNINTQGKAVGAHDVVAGVTHSDNKYYTNAPANEWFEYDGAGYDKAGWDALTGDTGSTVTTVTFVDATKTLETYMTSLGQASTLDEFLVKCRAQGDGVWDQNYTARYINAYFRAGYKEA